MYPKSEKQLSKEDKDARKFVVRNVADDLFSLVQGPRSQYYEVLGKKDLVILFSALSGFW
jgi:hypothetical protein